MPLRAVGLSETLGDAVAESQAEAAQSAGFVWTLLPRHGRRPARFLGRVLLRADNRGAAQNGRLPFWSDIHVHELFGGGFVISVRHMRPQDDRAGFQDVWLAHHAADVIALLRTHKIPQGLSGEPRPCAASPPPSAAWDALLDAMFGSPPA